MHEGLGVIENVQHFEPAHTQRIGDQRPVTAPPERFCAHDRSTLAPRELRERSERSSELRAVHVIRIAPEGGVPPGSVWGIGARLAPAAELGQPSIFDPALREHFLERSRRVLRMAA